jgi:hypothetical protein
MDTCYHLDTNVRVKLLPVQGVLEVTKGTGKDIMEGANGLWGGKKEEPNK